MQVGNGFPGVAAVIDDKSVATLRNLKLPGHFRSSQEELAQKFSIPGLGFADPGNHPAGNHEDMNGRLWLNISKRDEFRGLVNNFSRDFAAGDFFEESHLERKSEKADRKKKGRPTGLNVGASRSGRLGVT